VGGTNEEPTFDCEMGGRPNDDIALVCWTEFVSPVANDVEITSRGVHAEAATPTTGADCDSNRRLIQALAVRAGAIDPGENAIVLYCAYQFSGEGCLFVTPRLMGRFLFLF